MKVEEIPAPQLEPGEVFVHNHYSRVSAGTEKAVVEFAKQSLMG